MSDRELLELAAKAAGIEGKWMTKGDGDLWLFRNDFSDPWNPLTDDGDALRLAAKLRIDVLFDGHDSPSAHVETVANEPSLKAQPWAHEPLKFDEMGAIRLAIVRTAAKIGEAVYGITEPTHA